MVLLSLTPEILIKIGGLEGMIGFHGTLLLLLWRKKHLQCGKTLVCGAFLAAVGIVG